MVNMVGKIHKAQKVTEYYLTNEWNWATDNVEKLHKELSDADRKMFNFDLTALNWEEYIVDYVKVGELHKSKIIKGHNKSQDLLY